MSRNKRTREAIVSDLDQAVARLKDVQERGDEALSAYDLSLGYDAEFYLVRCPLLANHVRYYESELYQYDKENPQSNQLCLF